MPILRLKISTIEDTVGTKNFFKDKLFSKPVIFRLLPDQSLEILKMHYCKSICVEKTQNEQIQNTSYILQKFYFLTDKNQTHLVKDNNFKFSNKFHLFR